MSTTEITIHFNAVTGKPYEGGNQIKLLEAGEHFTSSQWATYKQWQSVGFQVRLHEHGVVLGRFLGGRCAGHKADETCSKCNAGGKKTFRVFNGEQVDAIDFGVEA